MTLSPEFVKGSGQLFSGRPFTDRADRAKSGCAAWRGVPCPGLIPAPGVDGLARACLIALLREMDQALAGGAASLLRQIANPKAAEADDDKHPPDAAAVASSRPAPATLPGIMQAFFGSRLIGHLQAALLQ